MNLQAIFDIPEICYQLGIRQAIISPGSRNGALTIAFARHQGIQCFSVPDERSAGFIGLGMSLKTQLPTVLICTSGSAGLNYAPAVSEAFFNRIPLLILTADRPAEMIDIRDGQTIFQQDLYGKHARAYFEFPENEGPGIALTTYHNIVQKAVHKSLYDIAGPVQINIPFNEPFYPEPGIVYGASSIRLTTRLKTKNIDPPFPENIRNHERIAIIVGQQPLSFDLNQLIEETSKKHQIPVIADVIANVNSVDKFISHHDSFLGRDDGDLQPDLILTFGLSVLSKKLKKVLRDSPGMKHWHISTTQDGADTFKKNVLNIVAAPSEFLSKLNETTFLKPSQKTFYTEWTSRNQRVVNNLKKLSFKTFSEPYLYKKVMANIPDGVDLHLANSMAVRYANLFGLMHAPNVEVFCNRGTSGIDGSNSTAVGSAMLAEKKTVLITGDVAFLYDRNAFWHNHVPDNLSVIVFNNGGGGIFRLIAGPSEHKELEEFFETRQHSSAEHVASEFGFDYLTCRNFEEVDFAMSKLNQPKCDRSIIEIFTDKQENQIAFRQLMGEIM